jgi:hypothetical protein
MSTPSTNKLLILNSILLVFILVVLIIVNFSKIKRLIKNQEDNYETSYDDYPDIKYYSMEDSLKVDFESLKNDTIPLPDKIIETMTTELKAYNWNDEFQTENIYNLVHETVFAKQFTLDPKAKKKMIVITFSNYSGNHSHVARGLTSLFEFQKQNQTWQLTRKYLAFGIGTENGMEPLWCKLVRIGNNNKYALIIQTNYSGNGGHEIETQAVYSEVGCSFELVFDFTNYEHYEDYPKDFNYTEGYQNMRILKSDKAWFDIETKKEDDGWNDKTPGAIKRFLFNGKEYVKANDSLVLTDF